LLGLSSTTSDRGTSSASSGRPRYAYASKSYETRDKTYSREEDKDQDLSDSESQDGYAELRAKVRALQREVAQKSSRLESLVQEKEDVTVALGHAKRDKAKVAAEVEQVELERDTLERENRRIKARLAEANKELKDLSDERRKLTERLTVVEGTRQDALKTCPRKILELNYMLLHPIKLTRLH
jgi:chromosome segregation ATPase